MSRDWCQVKASAQDVKRTCSVGSVLLTNGFKQVHRALMLDQPRNVVVTVGFATVGG
ncbi:MAG: hypothetical protein V7K48_03660 [Nostoc sp.]|uniref:hypothetical protein n=1 Tax=Nostoc sp. TaxID=1180 RepID=UPI002FFB3ED6